MSHLTVTLLEYNLKYLLKVFITTINYKGSNNT